MNGIRVSFRLPGAEQSSGFRLSRWVSGKAGAPPVLRVSAGWRAPELPGPRGRGGEGEHQGGAVPGRSDAAAGGRRAWQAQGAGRGGGAAGRAASPLPGEPGSRAAGRQSARACAPHFPSPGAAGTAREPEPTPRPARLRGRCHPRAGEPSAGAGLGSSRWGKGECGPGAGSRRWSGECGPGAESAGTVVPLRPGRAARLPGGPPSSLLPLYLAASSPLNAETG